MSQHGTRAYTHDRHGKSPENDSGWECPWKRQGHLPVSGIAISLVEGPGSCSWNCRAVRASSLAVADRLPNSGRAPQPSKPWAGPESYPSRCHLAALASALLVSPAQLGGWQRSCRPHHPGQSACTHGPRGRQLGSGLCWQCPWDRKTHLQAMNTATGPAAAHGSLGHHWYPQSEPVYRLRATFRGIRHPHPLRPFCPSCMVKTRFAPQRAVTKVCHGPWQLWKPLARAPCAAAVQRRGCPK
mmetsp:Transcript_86533/g.253312  ORF Transcript_86533/g.253312 Transcript_86533/m.253312 type:complete len:242 (-) Transcript_86533:359-1084(-)